MFSMNKIAYISSIFLLVNIPIITYADELSQQDIGNGNICGAQIIGDYNKIICTVSTWPLNNQKKGQLAELCSRGNFGAIRNNILFKTKERYSLGEFIEIEYAGACPGKTEFLIVKEDTKPDNRRNTGMRKRSVRVSDYQGQMEFGEGKLPKPSVPGRYVIHAYFTGRDAVYIAGRSLPFEIVDRF